MGYWGLNCVQGKCPICGTISVTPMILPFYFLLRKNDLTKCKHRIWLCVHLIARNGEYIKPELRNGCKLKD